MPMVLFSLMLVLFAVLLMSSWTDFRTMRIPNTYVGIVFVCFVAAYAAAPDAFGAWWEHAGACMIVLIFTYILFARGQLGAGDAKLGAAAALWAGLPLLFLFVFYMALMGGVLGIAALILKKKKPVAQPRPGSWVAVMQEGGNAVPYGIAISFGLMATLFHSGFISHRIDEVFKIIH